MPDFLGWILLLVLMVFLILYSIARNGGSHQAVETSATPAAVRTGRVGPGIERQWLAGTVVTIIDTAVCPGGEMAAMDYAELPTQPPTIMRVIIPPGEGWVWRCWFNGRTDNWYGSLGEAEKRMVDLLTRSSAQG